MLGFFKILTHDMKVVRYLFVEVLQEIYKMQAAITELKQAVEQQTTVVDGVVTLIQQMSQQLKDAADDPAEVRKLADQLSANSQKLADATVANTDAE